MRQIIKKAEDKPMTAPNFSLTRLMTTAAASVFTVVTMGCASAPSSAQEKTSSTEGKTIVIPDNSRPKEAFSCAEPTTTSVAATVVAAGIGHWLDKKSGGGRGHERDLGRAAHALTAPCVLVTEPPKPAP